MINLYIAHPSEKVARNMAGDLLKNKLVSRLSIDYQNHVFELQDEVVVESVICLITAQTKALLFNEIVQFIHSKYGEDTPVYSVPITQSFEAFTRQIREKTKNQTV
ncbi:MAG: hypothetical protein QM534_13315 [Sediminibacterium sp.]|nr:hypothetical protein [Sediminibacterium sp.]